MKKLLRSMHTRIGAIFMVCGCLVLSLTSNLQAKIYAIPPALQQETKVKYQIFQQNPASQEAMFELAMAYAYTGRIKKGWDTLKTVSPSYATEVVKKYSALSTEEPKEWRHKFKLAFGYYFLGQKNTAISEFQQVLIIDPANIWAMGYIALITGEQNQVETCVTWCQKALAIEPNATGIHFLLGEAYRRQGEIFKSLMEFCTVGRLLSEEARLRPDEDN